MRSLSGRHALETIKALVAQLDRASGYEPEGRGFESSPVRHTNKKGPAQMSGALFVCMAYTGELFREPPGFDKPAKSRRRTSPQSGDAPKG